MSHVPSDLKYAPTHEWVKQELDGTITMGITDHAQNALGDLVFVQLPEVGDSIRTAQDIAVVESVKAASDVYAPISGEIIARNEALQQTPELINTAPYTDGWLVKIK
ncbi:MAG: glycine cleavage system protein GcvH, partial [Gammaproteobacteria bacterium]|nr:glycine cleavage system protein GcvH [Gammaproteobacteria bacterium]